MIPCPKCQSELTESDIQSGRCSQCLAEFTPILQEKPSSARGPSADPPGSVPSGDRGIDATSEVDESFTSELALSDSVFDPDAVRGASDANASDQSGSKGSYDATSEVDESFASELALSDSVFDPDAVRGASDDDASDQTGSKASYDATAEVDESFASDLAASDSGLNPSAFGGTIEFDPTSVPTRMVESTDESSKGVVGRGSGKVGSARVGSGKVGSGESASSKSGSVKSGSGKLGSSKADLGTRDSSRANIRSGSGSVPGDSASGELPGSKTFMTEDVGKSLTHRNETVQLDSAGVPIELTMDVNQIIDDSDSRMGATLDSDAAALLHPSWVGALKSNANATMSLKSDVADSRGLSAGSIEAELKNTLHIQTRVILAESQEKDSQVPADYGVLEILGKGGMGVVYSAKQASLDRNVAVKMLLPEGAKNLKSRNAFLSEAAVTGDLEHPNIVPIYDLGRAPDGAFFYAMKHVHGTPWDKTIRETPLGQNLGYLLRVCDAMAFAHSKGILHRDLKPENTMIGDFGEVMVMDWGLAIPSDGRMIAGIELGECMAGTPSYMAPEMARGPFQNISTRSDIYLLGAILFEIVTGKPPHAGETSRKCMLNAAHNRIRKTDVNNELLDIAIKAMATNQAERYQTVKEFQDAIRVYQSHSESITLSTLAAESLATAEETGSYDDFNRSVFGYQQAVELWSDNEPAAAGLVQSKYAYAKLACDRGDYDLGAGLLDVSLAQHNALHTEIVKRTKDRERKQQRGRLYRQIGIGLAGALFLVISGAALWINSARQDAVTQREFADLATKDAELERAQAIEAKEAEQQQRLIAVQKQKDAERAKEQEQAQRELAEAAQVAEKKQRVAADNARMEAERANLAEQEQRKVAERQKQVAEQQRALAEQKRQEAIDARQSEAYEAYVARIAAASSRIDENAYLSALELLRDCIPAEGETDYRNWEWGRMVYLCQQATSVLPTENPLEAVAASNLQGEIDLVATAGDGGVITVWDPKSGKKKTIETSVERIHSIAFSPTQLTLAIGTDTPGDFIQIVDLASGKTETLKPGTPSDAQDQAVLSVDFSADGKRLLSASRGGKVKVWDIASRRALVTLHRHRSAVSQAKFFPAAAGRLQTKMISVSHDGNAVVWSDSSGRWASTASVKELGIFREHQGPIFAVAISNDGKQIASAGHGGRILLWSDADLKTVDLVDAIERNKGVSGNTSSTPLVGHTAAVRSLDFAKDSNLLISAGHDNTVRAWNADSGELIKVLRGHGRWVRGCVVADNGRTVASAGYDGAARFWDIEGYEELRVLRGKVLAGHEDGIMAASFSGDSNQIVTASRDRTVRSWESKTGKQLMQFREGHRFLAAGAVTYKDGRFLATAAGDETVRLWDIENGTEIKKLSGTGQGAAIDVSRDGRIVLTGGPIRKDADGASSFSARLWDAQTGQPIHQLLGHRALVSAVAISPDARLLYTGDVNGTGFLWDRSSGKLVSKLPWHQSKVIRAKFSSDGRRLITASFERGIASWDVATAQVNRDQILLHAKDLISVDIDRDCNRIVTSSEDGQIRVWDAATKQVLRKFAVTFGGKRSRIDKVAMSPDGGTVTVVNRQRGVARMYDVGSGREVTFPQTDGRPGGLLQLSDGSKLSTVVFAGDSAHVVSIGGDQIRLWGANAQLPQYRRLQMNFSPHGGVASADFSSDSSEIVSGSWDGTANIWNAKTGMVRLKLVGRHAGPVHCATFSPDAASRIVATASADRTIVLWNSKTGDFIRRLVGHTEAVNWIGFSPDGKRLVSASDDETARIWDLANAVKPLVFRHDSAVLRAVFSPDATRIACSTEGNLALVWQATNERDQSTPMFELAGHTAPVTSVAFSPDGKRAITGSEDFTAKVWDVTNRGPKELIALSGHERTVTSVAFSPDQLNILTGSQDGTAIIWMAGAWGEADRNQLKITNTIRSRNRLAVSPRLENPSTVRSVANSSPQNAVASALAARSSSRNTLPPK